MRLEYIFLLLGLSGAVQAATNTESEAPPDAELLEFLADWQGEDQDWLEGQMTKDQINEPRGEASVPATTAQETDHE